MPGTGGNVIDVEFERIGAGSFQRTAPLPPPPRPRPREPPPRGGPAILKPQCSVYIFRQRRSRGHQRILELEAEVVGGEIDHVRLPVWFRLYGLGPVPDTP